MGRLSHAIFTIEVRWLKLRTAKTSSMYYNYNAWNELTPKTAKHGEDVCDHDWAARPHPLLRINSGLFK